MLTLYSYYRSGTSYRVRMALNYKGIAYEQTPVNLKEGDQHGPVYRRLNPQGLLPALQTSDGLLTQSPAILDWIEETHPEPALLPAGAHDRAKVRAAAAIIGCDTHPIQNLRILKYLKNELGQDQAAVDAWSQHWIAEGFNAVERLIQQTKGPFAFGETPTLADIYILPQIYNAHRFGLDLKPYPRLRDIEGACEGVPAFRDAHPSRQPDSPAEG